MVIPQPTSTWVVDAPTVLFSSSAKPFTFYWWYNAAVSTVGSVAYGQRMTERRYTCHAAD